MGFRSFCWFLRCGFVLSWDFGIWVSENFDTFSTLRSCTIWVLIIFSISQLGIEVCALILGTLLEIVVSLYKRIELFYRKAALGLTHLLVLCFGLTVYGKLDLLSS